MRKIFFMLAVLVGIAASPLAFAAEPANVPDTVKSWIKPLNKRVVWEAGEAYDGRLVRFDQTIDTSKPAGFTAALASLNMILATAGHVPLKACVFDDAVVIRRLDQPACDSPI
jgi:4-hydroxy-L-threonine phosphate dehydrogenase PdxA